MPRPPKINTTQVHNRLLALMAHTTRYAFKGETRLARDARVSKSAVCRLLNGHTSPSFALVAVLTRALEKELGRTIDPREVVSTDGTYLTSSACALCGCKGCLPDAAYGADSRLKPEYQSLRPGQWDIVPAATTSDGRLKIVGTEPQSQEASQKESGDGNVPGDGKGNDCQGKETRA